MVIRIVAFILLLAGLVFGVYFVSQKINIQTRASSNSVVLSFVAPASVNPGSTFDLGITAAPPITGTALKVTSTKITITYPTSLLTVSSITAGPFFKQSFVSGQTKMLEQTDTTTPGKIILNYGTPCTVASPLQCFPTISTGVIATVRFQSIANTTGSATFAFDPATTLVTAIDSGGNAITSSVLDTTQLASATTSINTPITFPASGLISYWKLDSSAADGLNKLNGSFVGTTAVPGKIGNGRSFNGSTDKIVLTGQPNITGAFSISAWVNFASTNLNSTQAIFNNNRLFVRKDPVTEGNRISIFARLSDNSVEPRAQAKTTIVANTWYHVVCTWDGTTLKTYINGSLSQGGSSNRPGTLAPTPITAQIGMGEQYSTTLNPFSGILDEMGMWNRALTAAEVTSLYNSGSGISYP